MHHRIGSLHVRYRVHGGSMDAALTPGFDRAIQSGLADAVSARLAVMFGDDPSVTVVRELSTAAALGKQDVIFDSRVVERVCASSVDALWRMLTREDSSESLVRFADEAEFVGSFLVDLVDGHAWDHWYYGAFQRYRRGDAPETIRVVLGESGVEPARVLAWLSRRGKLDAVLGLMAAGEALAMVDARQSLHEDSAGTSILAEAALQLAAALGLGDVATSQSELIARFLATEPPTARWTDRRSLSAWVLGLIRFVASASPDARPLAAAELQEAARELLTGTLDWLDGPWLMDHLSALLSGMGEAHSVVRAPGRPLLTTRQSLILASLAHRLRVGRMRVPDGTSESELIVRLIAAATEDMQADEALDRTLVSAIEEIARSSTRTIAPDSPAEGEPRFEETTSAEELRSLASAASKHRRASEPLRRYGSAATEVLQALQAIKSGFEEEWQVTQAGGLFLLLRALIDTRLPALARQSDVPLPPLLGALAIKLFDLRAPFDVATSLWVGEETPALQTLETSSAEIRALELALLDLLVARRVLDEVDAGVKIEADARLLTATLPCSRQTDAAIAHIASLLTHAWSHWLRGIAHSSVSFLLDNCLRRAARVQMTAKRIAVELDPSPLDIVLQMAGYFAPVDEVPWLSDRSVALTVRRAS